MSLGRFARQKMDKPTAHPAIAATGSRWVLPRVFRWPARVMLRLFAGNISISRTGWLRMALGALVIFSAGTYANTRHGHSVVGEISAGLGFSIDKVVVEGLRELSKIDVIASLKPGPSKSLFSFDLVQARENLNKIAWIKDVVVAKSYPNRLLVNVTERIPFAIWQKGKALVLIERDGVKIAAYEERYSNLPLLVGKGANTQGADIVYLTGNIGVLKNNIKAYVRVGGRRWDLRLKNGITVRLPDEDLGSALQRLATLDQQHQLLSRDVEIVDLRLRDRLVVSPGQFTKQRAAIAQRALENRGEKKI